MDASPDPEHERLLRGRRQPDDLSCGASCVVAVPMLVDPAVAARLEPPEAWDEAVLAAHRQITAVRDPRAPGTLPPWPRRLGTPPWAAARRLRAEPGGTWGVRVVRGGRREEGWAAVGAAAGDGHPSLLCVGTRFSPRHFLLVLPGTAGTHLWDPARGEVRPLGREGYLAGAITGGAWPVPWFLVVRAGRG